MKRPLALVGGIAATAGLLAGTLLNAPLAGARVTVLERSYLAAAQMLHALGVPRVALLSNNPDKARQLRRFGVTVTQRVPTGVHLSATNARYLATKARRGAHTLDLPLSAG